jgi:bifunctional UDP-N-acetylglucosamine pyrophosphorylase/glucosamine-1-phosphate N-acetyltransferase
LKTQDATHIFILAAGKGSRMHSALPKIMHPLAGLPLIGHVLQEARSLKPQTCTLVVSPHMEEVQAFASQFFPALRFAVQDQQFGTAHATKCALEGLPSLDGKVIILFGDTPLIQRSTLETLNQHLNTHEIVVVGMTPDDPKNYARIVLEKDQTVQKIVEHKEANEEERAIPLCNSGILGVHASCLRELLSQIEKSPLTGEYYLFDLISLAKATGRPIGFMEVSANQVEGVNTRADLALCENLWQERYRQQIMLSGVTLLDPSSVYFSYDTQIGRDTIIEPHVFFGPGVLVEENVRIHAFCHLEKAVLRQGSQIGPFARLRPKTEIGPGACVGNFVEIIRSQLGAGSKAKHLAYLGDTTVGEYTNIGAGTITCNYDGTNKWNTIIGERVFIGSNTALIAPVVIHTGAIVGAGSTITGTIEADALAMTRAPQKKVEGGAALFRSKCLKLKAERDQK